MKTLKAEKPWRASRLQERRRHGAQLRRMDREVKWVQALLTQTRAERDKGREREEIFRQELERLLHHWVGFPAKTIDLDRRDQLPPMWRVAVPGSISFRTDPEEPVFESISQPEIEDLHYIRTFVSEYIDHRYGYDKHLRIGIIDEHDRTQIGYMIAASELNRGYPRLEVITQIAKQMLAMMDKERAKHLR